MIKSFEQFLCEGHQTIINPEIVESELSKHMVALNDLKEKCNEGIKTMLQELGGEVEFTEDDELYCLGPTSTHPNSLTFAKVKKAYLLDNEDVMLDFFMDNSKEISFNAKDIIDNGIVEVYIKMYEIYTSK